MSDDKKAAAKLKIYAVQLAAGIGSTGHDRVIVAEFVGPIAEARRFGVEGLVYTDNGEESFIPMTNVARIAYR